MSVAIYYDGLCPFCSRYVRYLRLKEAAGSPRLVDLREAPDERKRLEARGFDLDQGMVAEVSGRYYGGRDAVHVLALLSSRSGVFNRVNALLFRYPFLAALLYPVMRAFRNATIFMMGRPSIRGDSEHNRNFFYFFSLVFGFFAIQHFTIYTFSWQPGMNWSTWLLFPFGLVLFFRPDARRVFVLLLFVMALDAWYQAPIYSNHTILKNFFLVSILLSGLWCWMRGGRWAEFSSAFVPVGRLLLLVMYFFGVFHKVNEGFLDPEVSCAVALWEEMPAPISFLEGSFILYSAIYGTFLVEIFIALCLLIPRFRHVGIVSGILFHSFLALSGYALYPPFSTLSILLHCLFLSPSAVSRILHSREFRAFREFLVSGLGLVMLAAWLFAYMLSAYTGNNASAGIVWLLAPAGLLYLVLRYGRDASPLHGFSLLWGRPQWINVVGIAFFLNCAAPYAGLKTAQTLNMFANLHLEGGQSNHVIMRWAPGPFGYLDDTVEIVEARGIGRFSYAAREGFHVVYYDLLDELARNPGGRVTFIRDGKRHEHQGAQDLQAEIERLLHPEWFRKWFHFRRVDFREPRPCGRA